MLYETSGRGSYKVLMELCMYGHVLWHYGTSSLSPLHLIAVLYKGWLWPPRPSVSRWLQIRSACGAWRPVFESSIPLVHAALLKRWKVWLLFPNPCVFVLNARLHHVLFSPAVESDGSDAGLWRAQRPTLLLCSFWSFKVNIEPFFLAYICKELYESVCFHQSLDPCLNVWWVNSTGCMFRIFYTLSLLSRQTSCEISPSFCTQAYFWLCFPLWDQNSCRQVKEIQSSYRIYKILSLLHCWRFSVTFIPECQKSQAAHEFILGGAVYAHLCVGLIFEGKTEIITSVLT